MPRYYKAPNKRIIPRAFNGRFRKATLQDVIPGALIQQRKAVSGGSEKSDLELLEQFVQTNHPILLRELIDRGVITGFETESQLLRMIHFMKTGEKLEEPKPPSLMDLINRK